MTVAAADEIPSSLPDGKAAATLLPTRLRASLTVFVVAAHVAALLALSLHARDSNILEPIDVDVIPQGNFYVDTIAIAGAAAAEAVEQHQTQAPQPKPEPSDAPAPAAPPPPPAQQALSPTPSVVAPDPAARDAELAAREMQRMLGARRLREARAKARREAEAEERRKEMRREARRRMAAHRDEIDNARASNRGGSEGHRAGAPNGRNLRAARLNYGAVIAAELNRHKFYPPRARARGETGSVEVSFTVGGAGRIVAHSIYRSSGSSALDGAVHSMMASTHAPPPPGGSFHGSIVINFNLGR